MIATATYFSVVAARIVKRSSSANKIEKRIAEKILSEGGITTVGRFDLMDYYYIGGGRGDHQKDTSRVAVATKLMLECCYIVNSGHENRMYDYVAELAVELNITQEAFEPKYKKTISFKANWADPRFAGDYKVMADLARHDLQRSGYTPCAEHADAEFLAISEGLKDITENSTDPKADLGKLMDRLYVWATERQIWIETAGDVLPAAEVKTREEPEPEEEQEPAGGYGFGDDLHYTGAHEFKIYDLYLQIEKEIAARLFRSYSQAKMNMIAYVRPFFSMRAMTGRRGSRS